MQLKVIDGLGIQQTIVAKGLEIPIDHSGTIAATGVSQTLLAPNLSRSGWHGQNTSAHTLYWNDTGAASSGAGSYQVVAGAFFPPVDYLISTGAISITGTVGDTFTIKECTFGSQSTPGTNSYPYSGTALLNFGTTPTFDGSFVITDANITLSNAIDVIPLFDTEHGKSMDEWEMDAFIFSAFAGDGRLTIYSSPVPGPVSGIFKIHYQVS